MIAQQFPTKPGSCTTVPLRLNENPDHVAALIDRSPKVLAAPRDLHEHLIKVPNVTSLSVTPFRGSRVFGADLHTPAANRLVRHLNASLREQIFDVSKTERKAMIEPNGVSDDFFWVAVTSVVRLRMNIVPFCRRAVNVTKPDDNARRCYSQSADAADRFDGSCHVPMVQIIPTAKRR